MILWACILTTIMQLIYLYSFIISKNILPFPLSQGDVMQLIFRKLYRQGIKGWIPCCACEFEVVVGHSRLEAISKDQGGMECRWESELEIQSGQEH
jgi:hypothetical protein